MPYRVGAVLAALLFAVPAWAQMPPAGEPVINQARQALALTPSDATVFSAPTRGLHVGDAAACNISVVFAGDSSPVTLFNVQPGLAYPYSIKQLRSTSTTCAAITGLW